MIDFEFVATVSSKLSLDPKEFTGMSVSHIAEAIERLLKEMRPDASFYYDDVVLAAEQLANG